MKEAFVVINQKGGVGKSTTALALGAGLLLKGFNVLYIDLDAQGNLTDTLGATSDGFTVLDVLARTATAEQAIQKLPHGDVIPACPALSGADTVLTSVGKEYPLQEALEPIKARYDYIIVDTPPALGVLTINALTACTGAIIPSQADVYSLQGISQLYNTIETVKRYCNPSLKIIGIILTRYSSRSVLSREIAEAIEATANELQTILFKAKIREAVAIKESQAQRQSIFSYAPKSNVATDYVEFIEELLELERS